MSSSKIYLFCGSIVLIDIICWGIAAQFMSLPKESSARNALAYVIFVPIILASGVQVLRAIYDISHGYITSGLYFGLEKYSIKSSPLLFLIGVFVEFVAWGGLMYSLASFLSG